MLSFYCQKRPEMLLLVSPPSRTLRANNFVYCRIDCSHFDRSIYTYVRRILRTLGTRLHMKYLRKHMSDAHNTYRNIDMCPSI